MATMYALFFGVLFNAVCSVKRNGNSDVKHQTFLLAQAASGSYFFSAKKYAKNSSLKTFDTKEVPPPTIVKIFLGDTESECRDYDSFICKLEKDDLQTVFLTLNFPRPSFKVSASSSLQTRPMSPVKLLTIAQGGTSLQSKGSSDEAWTLGRYQVSRPSGMEDYKRIKILDIASKELGVKELTNNNDGPRVEEYLKYTDLSKGHQWCAAFVSWCYGQAGLAEPRNPWSPALFPNKRLIKKEMAQPADVFGIYAASAKRINHVGLVKQVVGDYLISIEGNSNNRVESRRRHLRTVYAVAKWL